MLFLGVAFVERYVFRYNKKKTFHIPSYKTVRDIRLSAKATMRYPRGFECKPMKT